MGIALVIGLSSWAIYHTACFLVEGMANFDEQRQQQFNTTLFYYLLIFAASGVVVGSFLHVYLTRRIVAPIRRLIQSMRELEKGSYPKKITVMAKGELGLLIEQYNQMIEQLKAHDGERKKLIADLSHETRTPLANLQGYLHGLQTGVITGDKVLYRSLYNETKRLTNLIEQLDQLKELDNKIEHIILPKDIIHISKEIEQCLAMFEWALTEKGISLHVNVDEAEIHANEASIQRVLTNLIDNAIRYYVETGPIEIVGIKKDTVYKISVKGPSEQIPYEAKEKLFDRFYRVDQSRNRSSGGTRSEERRVGRK